MQLCRAKGMLVQVLLVASDMLSTWCLALGFAWLAPALLCNLSIVQPVKLHFDGPKETITIKP